MVQKSTSTPTNDRLNTGTEEKKKGRKLKKKSGGMGLEVTHEGKRGLESKIAGQNEKEKQFYQGQKGEKGKKNRQSTKIEPKRKPVVRNCSGGHYVGKGKKASIQEVSGTPATSFLRFTGPPVGPNSVGATGPKAGGREPCGECTGGKRSEKNCSK